MIRIITFCLCLLYSMPSCIKKVSAQQPRANALPVLKAFIDTGMVALQIVKLNVEIKITGDIATTIFDLTYYNDSDEVLEGQFDFPLADGQHICRYALDINDVLREGVVVEKAKARVADESTIRQKIDPGLVEKTRGNNFRTRIYPIPPKGFKRVVIGVEQALASADRSLLYQLPLKSEQPIKSFSISATVFNDPAKPVLQNNSFNGFNFVQNNGSWRSYYEEPGIVLNNQVDILVPQSETGRFYTEKYDGHNYFYAHIPLEKEFRNKKHPRAITLLWDVSSSSVNRDVKKELELLSMYIRKLDRVTINLVPFNISMLPAEKFTISNGDATRLVKRLETFEVDGGTQLGSIDLSKIKDDEILLFSDGLSTFGKKEILIADRPVIPISSAPVADNAYLRFVALKTHGRFINLNETPAAEAVNELEKEAMQFISAVYNEQEITGFYSQLNTQLHNGFSFAGISQKDFASVTLNFGYGNNIAYSKTMKITAGQGDAENIKRIWAARKIAWLELEYQKNKAEITRIGKQFSIVTQNTSLLVLDRVEDYLEHEIIPPAELQKEYYTLLQEKLSTKKDEKAAAFEEALTAMTEMKEWYQKKHNPVKRPVNTGADSSLITLTDNGSISAMVSPVYDSLGSVINGVSSHYTTSNANLSAVSIAEPNQQWFTAPALAPDEMYLEGEQTAGKTNLTSRIQLNEWKPDAPYLKELDKAGSNYYQKYLALKSTYKNQPSFFADVARYFFEKKNRQLALQVLPNITEMKLEDPELLRVVASQLVEFGEKDLAVLCFEELLEIREEEPQAHRDLALAYSEAGKYQKAIDMLYHVATGVWEDRFDGVRSIALNELNAIISAKPGLVSVTAIDDRLISSMPLDVRIVVGWSTNDSDIDLWITDPVNEKCSYQNTGTSSGGRISTDMTQGYGPEEFILRKAARGNYDVEVNLYGDRRQTLGGPITIQAELFTNYGKPSQVRKLINFRVTTDKEVVKVGSLRFDPEL